MQSDSRASMHSNLTTQDSGNSASASSTDLRTAGEVQSSSNDELINQDQPSSREDAGDSDQSELHIDESTAEPNKVDDSRFQALLAACEGKARQ